MKLKKLLAAVISLCLVLSAFPAFTAFAAEDIPSMGNCGKNGDNVSYVYQDGTLTIAGTGEMADYEKYTDNETPYEDIKRFVKTVVVQAGVTRIGNYAFGSCDELQSVTLPEGIVSIGDYAFSSAYSLRNITLPESLETLGTYSFGGSFIESITIPSKVKEISDSCFMSCDQLTSVTLPEGLEAIGNTAFGYDNKLTDITIPNTVKSIGSHAFTRDEALTSITIPNSVTFIDYGAFYDCTALASVTLPNGLADIYDSVFCGCTALTTIEIPESVTYIGDQAFCRSGIKNITIPKSVEYLNSSSFTNCADLEEITVDEQNGNYTSINGSLYSKDGTELLRFVNKDKVTSFTPPESVKTVKDSAFSNEKILESVDLSGVDQIEGYLFSNCESLKTVKLPDHIYEIPYSCFSGCTALESVTIPSSVRVINYSAFYNCMSLKKIEIPEGVTEIGESAFSACKSLESLNIPSSVTDVGWNIIGGTALYNSLPLENSIKYLDGWAVGLASPSNVVFKEGTIGISGQILGSTAVTVYIPKTVKYISKGGLQGAHFSKIVESYTVDAENPYYCSEDGVVFTKDKTELVAYPQNGNFIRYTVPEGVKFIRDYAFYNSVLEEVTFPTSLIHIGNWAFYNSKDLKTALLTENVEFIGNWAFGYCSNVDLGQVPDSLKYIGYNIFDMTSNSNLTTVDGNAYLGKWLIRASAVSGDEFKIPEGTVGIAANAIYSIGMVRSTSAYIPASVKHISSGAFRYFINLKDVYFAGSREDWERMNIGDKNAPLLEAHIHFEDQTPPFYGDVDNDGKISSNDALMVLQNVVGILDLTDEQYTVANVDDDDRISSGDALLILQRTVGIIDLFPVEEK